MRLVASTISAMAVLLTFASANAQDLTLTCEMNDYVTAGNSAQIRELVPPHGVHTIESSTAHLEGTSMSGSAEDGGSRVRIRYVGYLKGIGDTEAVYTYIRSSGIMIARTTSLGGVNSDRFFGEKPTQFIINGHCTSK